MSKLERFDALLNRIDEAEFIQYFNELHSFSEFKEHFNINTSAYYRLIKYFNLKHYEADSDILEKQRVSKIKQTNLERYGYENVFQVDSVKVKAQNTLLEKYGVENSMQSIEIQQKTKNTNLERYGCSNPAQSKLVQDKIKKTCLEKYGTKSALQAESIKEKIKNTNLEKYGYKNISQSVYWHEKVSETNLDKYSLPWACMRQEARFKGNDSKPNKQFMSLLEAKFNEHIENISREFPLDNFSYDFKYNKYLIEINPAITHNSTIGIYNTDPKSKMYHYNKTITAKNAGFKCIHVWDWDNKDLILDIINNDKIKIFARKCTIKNVTAKDVGKFLAENHLQGTCKNQSICLGLYFNNELIQLITFGKPRYNKNYQYELLRLCTKRTYLIIGGAEKLFKYFITTYNPKSIISYCDNAKFTGDIYLKLGFKLKTYGMPSKHWYNLTTQQHITDNLLRQRGFDQLFNTNYGKEFSNEQLMLEHNFLEIYDCGQSVYIYGSN